MKIKIYTTQVCPWCIAAKKYFTQKGLEFEEIDVSADPKNAAELIRLSGQSAVPVIIINKKMIIGFDKNKIEEILKNE